MPTTDILNLTGLFFNIIGSILLGVSLSRYLTSIHGAIFFHDKQIQSLINRDSKILIADVANILKTGVENSRLRTTVGLILIVTGFAIQLVPYIINILTKK